MDRNGKKAKSTSGNTAHPELSDTKLETRSVMGKAAAAPRAGNGIQASAGVQPSMKGRRPGNR